MRVCGRDAAAGHCIEGNALPIDHDYLLNFPFGERTQRYEAKDTILYALGLGCGDEPGDLSFVYERDLRALPSMATVLGDPGFWLTDPKLGADAGKAVHAEQTIVLHRPLPPAGEVVALNGVDGIVDKGPGRGLLVHISRRLLEKGSGAPLATLGQTIMLRGDGGNYPSAASAAKPEPLPERAPDIVVSKKTLPQAALIYRLSGDWNPLHADPEAAEKAGFPAPILHGLCTMGIATRAIVKACCDNDPARLGSLGVRFTAPVFPGETLDTEIWRSGPSLQFRCTARERSAVVLNSCTATLRD